MNKVFSGLLKKYKSLTAPVKASLWFTICSVFQKGIAFLTTPIFTRLLSTEEYGKFSVYQSWYSIIAIFATLNLSYGVFNNGMVKYKNRDGFSSSMLGLSSVITAVLFLFLLMFQNTISGLLEMEPVYCYLILLECFFYPAFSLWAARQRYEYRYKNLVLVTLLMSFLNPVVGVVCIKIARDKAFARIASFVFVEIVFCIFFYVKNFRSGRLFFSKEFWKFALSFNIPLIPHYLSQTVLNQADRIMIGSMVGKGEAAIYSVAYSISMMMLIITTAINNSFIPYTYQRLKNQDYADIGKSAKKLLILVASVSVIAMAFCPEIILLVGGREYYDAIYVMPAIAASVYFMFLYTLFGNIEFFYEKTRFTAMASGFAAVVNVGLNFVFIRIYGYYAAGYTTLICYGLSAMAHYVFYRRILKEKGGSEKIYSEKWILFLSAIVLAGMLGMLFLYRFTMIRYFFIVVCVFICFVFRKQIVALVGEIRNKRKGC